MSMLAIWTCEIKRGQEAQLKDFLRRELPNSRNFEGCEGITTHLDRDNPNHLTCVCRYESSAVWESYKGWRKSTGKAQELWDMLEWDKWTTYDNIAI